MYVAERKSLIDQHSLYKIAVIFSWAIPTRHLGRTPRSIDVSGAAIAVGFAARGLAAESVWTTHIACVGRDYRGGHMN